jgi:ribonucleoside-diphosphate reductase beta chain
MPALTDLLAAGPPPAREDDGRHAPIPLLEPQALYELWERQQWSAHAIDLERDARDWEAIDPELRRELIWHMAGFFLGEERVTTQFAGLVMAYETQAEAAFLASQLVDEARHTQHFARFYEQVLHVDGSLEDRLAVARRKVGPTFVEIFDEMLGEWGARLIADPGDAGAKVDFVVLYHMIIEGTLALTGQWFLTEFMERRGILPGWTEGFRLITRDEHRHVAYGTWFLREKAADPVLGERIAARLRELIPIAQDALVPAGIDPAAHTVLDFPPGASSAFAAEALGRRLRVIGIGPAQLAAA